MSSPTSELRHLAARVSMGDPTAAVALKQELEPDMLRIVRRAMRATTGPSALTGRVRAAARRLSPAGADHAATDSAWLAGQVAQDVCDSMIGRLQADRPDGHKLRDTVRA